jgi:hypothetical protein
MEGLDRRVPSKGPGSSEPRYHGSARIAFLASVRRLPAADQMSSRSLVHLRSTVPTWYHEHAGQAAIRSASVWLAKAGNPRSISRPDVKGSFDEAAGKFAPTYVGSGRPAPCGTGSRRFALTSSRRIRSLFKIPAKGRNPALLESSLSSSLWPLRSGTASAGLTRPGEQRPWMQNTAS